MVNILKNKLFTIILTYYNQPKLIYDALDSIMIQDYKNIELIVTDDGSNLNVEKVKKYINKNNKDYIKNVEFIINKENIGTVKTLNKALKIAKGDYILFFAADDTLYNKSVISNFAKAFKDNLNDYIITAQAYMYNYTLTKSLGKYVNVDNAYQNNKLSSKKLYRVMCDNCIYGAGATAYRKEIFQKLDYFISDYNLIEDWSFWLRATRNGYKIKYVNFNALKHRDGGVSKSENKKKKPITVYKYYYDLALINVKEIMPYLNHFQFKKNINILKKYNSIIYFLNVNAPEFVDNKIISKKLYFIVPELFLYKMMIKIKAFFLKGLKRIKRYIILFVKKPIIVLKKILKYIIWIALNFLVLLVYDNYLKLIIIIINFYISLILNYILIKIYKKIRGRI